MRIRNHFKSQREKNAEPLRFRPFHKAGLAMTIAFWVIGVAEGRR